jgi:hypothetical protein
VIVRLFVYKICDARIREYGKREIRLGQTEFNDTTELWFVWYNIKKFQYILQVDFTTPPSVSQAFLGFQFPLTDC